MSDTDIQVVSNSWAGIQRVAATPKPPEFFRGREGYVPEFFGDTNRVELPSMGDAISMDDIAKLEDGSFELKYQHFSTVQCISRRVPLYSACNIDGSKSKNVPRHDTWNYDGRIRKEYQMLREAYGPEQDKKFSRGHMTRRQDPNWGSLATAQRANIDTFFATNACPQWQPFNDGLWGDLEDYILGNAQGDDKRISVFTGPILRSGDPERFGIQIPRDFWKVVAFISEATGELSAIAYLMSQGTYLDSGVARDLEDFDTSQRPLAFIEAETGLKFESLEGRDVLDGVDIAFVQPIRRYADTKLPA
ncbi:DNA/RNA non-specific endonuclease [Variovorax paradoxus]|uniref:DNA/RNA non-specific endonuclease n=1 Tax=Variovorax paradoxus TaxID=34073 RepID=UPI0021AD46BF|nr:DNA/RNA non-specific endonuclease [Variovorax paradoxus]UVH57016.1 DNA/RNA non-specific endonuclease [Variovorax paradoxus]